MSSIRNLYDRDAALKVKELVDAANICMFITTPQSLPSSARPMGTMRADKDGTLWFFSKRGSDKNAQIALDSRVQLYYANKGSSEYLSLFGEAEVLYDKGLAKELWSPIAKAWFTEGVDDPELTVIRVTPHDAYYWDTKSNKMISLVKILAGAIVGKTMDDGVEGGLELKV